MELPYDVKRLREGTRGRRIEAVPMPRARIPTWLRILLIGGVLVLGGIGLVGVGSIDDAPERESLQTITGTVQRIERHSTSRSSPFLRIDLLDASQHTWWVQVPDLIGSVPALKTITAGQVIEVHGNRPGTALGRPILWAWEIVRGQEVLLPYDLRVRLHRDRDRRIRKLGKAFLGLGVLALVIGRLSRTSLSKAQHEA